MSKGTPPFVGLTGGIGAGKSEALSALERLGAATLSTDAVVHELLESGEVRDLLVERFGERVAADGRVDRNVVATVVFGDPDERKWLEGVLWPRVGARVNEWREQIAHRDPPPRAAVVEVPLLFESGMEAVFDHTIAVVADEDLRRERAAKRGHAGVDSREAVQLSQSEKAERADYIVRNDRDIDDLQQELSGVLEKMGL
ncbi:MAG TPA: dephospho-CoA kinase [Thermoleophilaceae bacterium]|nr:dephospho-CoA kinase [Thermoleophilaceae bacterium]